MSFQDPQPGYRSEQEIVGPPGHEAREPRTPAAKRTIATITAAGVVAAAIGGGFWLWQSFMAQGAQPAEVLPATTLAYAALDLDPPGGQKIAAYNTLRQFPSIREELGLDSADDMKKAVVDTVGGDSGCDFTYAAVKPWLGQRLAVAAVELGEPTPVAVLQVKDEETARTSLTKLGDRCGFGFTVDGGWAILAESDSVVSQVAKAAAKGTLKDDGDFQRLTDAAGDAGLVTLYAAPEAGDAILDVIEQDPFTSFFLVSMLNSATDPVTSFVTSFGLLSAAAPDFEAGGGMEGDVAFEEPELTPEQQRRQDELDKKFESMDALSEAERQQLFQEQDKLAEEIYGGAEDEFYEDDLTEQEGFDDEFPTPQINADLRKSLQDFTGLGGAGRFSDGNFEVEVVGDQLNGTSSAMYGGNQGADRVENLPADTAIAFGAGLADGWPELLFDQFNLSFMYDDRDDAIRSFEKSSGLQVPEDLEALGGEGVSVSVGSGFDPDDFFEEPDSAAFGARIHGDAAKVEAALEKWRSHNGKSGAKVLSREIDGDVVISLSSSYLDELTTDGDLGGSDKFEKVLPDRDDATTVLFIDFDAGDWLAKSAGGDDRADAEPLDTFGMTVTKDGGEQRIKMRLRFDE